MSENIHYYGWKYIIEKLNESSICNTIKCVDYIDNYFIDLIEPIECRWFGFIHHTTSNFSENNINNLFSNTMFLRSLKTCKALIVLCKHSKEIVNRYLNTIKSNVHVYFIKHPAPPTFNYVFDINIFENKGNVYGVGAWLRNPYTIYHTTFKYNEKILDKYRLKGLLMNQYFQKNDKDFSDIINYDENKIIEIDNNDIDDEIIDFKEELTLLEKKLNKKYSKLNKELQNCKNEEDAEQLHREIKLIDAKYDLMYSKLSHELKNIDIHNKAHNTISRFMSNINYYDLYAKKYIDTMQHKTKSQTNRILINNNKSVNITNYVNNMEYIELLSSNIIFCNFIDCAASNTIIECISTSTPIILNRLPAIEEYLGENYPFYLDNLNYVDDVLTLTRSDILNCHEYLKNLDKKDLEISHFIKSIKSIIDISLDRNKKFNLSRFKRFGRN